MPHTASPRTLRIAAAVAVVFGTLTVFSGARALFGPMEARAALGQVVPWVLWFNFLAGFAYVAVGAGLWRGAPRWAVWGALGIAAATALVALAFGLHVATGGGFEMRTVGALALRLGVWMVLAGVAWRCTCA